MGKTEAERIVDLLSFQGASTIEQMLQYLEKDNTEVTRRNLKSKVLKELVETNKIVKLNDTLFDLAGDDTTM